MLKKQEEITRGMKYAVLNSIRQVVGRSMMKKQQNAGVIGSVHLPLLGLAHFLTEELRDKD